MLALQAQSPAKGTPVSRIVTLTLSPTIDMATNAPRLEPFSKLRCSAPHYDPGGGGINVARVIRRLGGSVTAVYPVGGAMGHVLHRLMDREGVDSLTVTTTEETRQNITVFDEESARQFRFVMPGPALSAAELAACLDQTARAVEHSTWLVASGSLPGGAPETAFADVARIAARAGVSMALDTSGPALKAALKAGVRLIKPNLREFQELTGADSASDDVLIAAGRRYVASGAVEAIALTLGPGGALLISRDGVLRAEGLAIEPVSVVGAGDSFFGAFVAATAAGKAPEEALRAGVAAGSAALMHPGTELCRAADAARLMPRITVRRLA